MVLDAIKLSVINIKLKLPLLQKFLTLLAMKRFWREELFNLAFHYM